MKGLIKLLAGVLLLPCSAAFASITVYPISVEINKKGNNQVKVMSSSSEIEYVKTTIKRIENPGTKMEKEVAADSTDKLIITPGRFALAAGTTRVVRFVNLVPPQTEGVYRVYFQAVPGLEENVPLEGKTVSGEIGVNMIWGVLIIVPPVVPVQKVTFNPTQNQLINNGNVHITLSQVGWCPSKNTAENCQWTSLKNTIYPGQNLVISRRSNNSTNNNLRVKYSTLNDHKILESVF